MSSTRIITLRYPDQVFAFADAPPPPQPWTKPTSLLSNQNLARTESLQWKQCNQNDKSLNSVLSHLQDNLRFAHKRKVEWPTDESYLSSLPPKEYLKAVFQPTVDLFNRLHAPGVLKTPMSCVSVEFVGSTCGAAFTADDFKKTWSETPPLVIALPDALFESSGQVSSQVSFALSQAIEYCSTTTSIIVSNFKDIAVFHPPSSHRPEAVFEKVSTDQPLLALRIITTAYLHRARPPGGQLIQTPDLVPEVEDDVILPEGPPKDPSQPLASDEEVFATHHRHSDFDMATLVRDRARALQFFRWHEHVQRQYSKLVAHPEDLLTARTNEVGSFFLDLGVRPIYPFEHSEITPETDAHIKSIQRVSPLASSNLDTAFKTSKAFTLKIQSVVSEGSKYGICTVYRCQITSIDNRPVSSPSLCLKLFDDRFQSLESPDEDEEYGGMVPRWFDRAVYAEMYALNEAFAYDKLSPVQGSVVPWFFGTHEFTLSDGTVLYGLLMEYIEGWKLDSEFPRTLSAERQIKMIQSCRHAVRVLDVADVSQRDWHEGQILLYTNPKTKVDHVVLIDFASTTQTWLPEEVNYIHNYFGVLHTLLGGEGDVGLNRDLVWKHFGEPDDWDPVHAFIPVRPRSYETRTVEARDMFPFIHQI